MLPNYDKEMGFVAEALPGVRGPWSLRGMQRGGLCPRGLGLGMFLFVSTFFRLPLLSKLASLGMFKV